MGKSLNLSDVKAYRRCLVGVVGVILCSCRCTEELKNYLIIE